MIVVHVTHEAVEKMGGIGTVIDGLTTCDAYREAVSRTILVGPLFSNDPRPQRLGPAGEVLYSSLDELTPSPWREKFNPIERVHDVGIVYGRRTLEEPYGGRKADVEVLLLDVFHINQERLNLLKFQMWDKFQVPSEDFQNIWEYEQYVRLAEPAYAALQGLGVVGGDEPVLLLAHEYMGMPTALKAILDGDEQVKTVFYAHEVASVRPIVEKNPGHDTMFYNALSLARPQGQTLEDLFPAARENFKHPLVKAARYCDHIFAVGDQVVEELRFLDTHFARVDIDLVYNGVPHEEYTAEQKRASRELLRDYAEALLGRRPTWIFTHVARPVLSKGIWRDLRVMHEMEPLLAERGETAVYFMLGTLGGQRRGQDIRQMEKNYGWPVRHEMGYPDLCGGEEVVGETFQAFNDTHQQGRAVLVNQWGWARRVCGERMPETMDLADLRRGTDLEFGLSVYEPFGISQLEPLCYGALCAVSDVCGCTGFARRAMNGQDYPNVLISSFLGAQDDISLPRVLSFHRAQRDTVETASCHGLAEVIIQRLPRDEGALDSLMQQGRELAGCMSWDRVVEEYFLPSLEKTARQR